ncbi:hypothetical protein [Nocardioides panacihumi]|uniref:hypothetical protein n=1 Tax=Nocardioides panacihumi TaxID=400774 RepID=UPI0031DFF1D7
MRPFIERCPHSASVGEAGAAVLAGSAFAGRTAGLTTGFADVEAPAEAADLSRNRASRIARTAASLLIV